MDNISNNKKHDPVVLSLNFHNKNKSFVVKSSQFKIVAVSVFCLGALLCTTIFSTIFLMKQQQNLTSENAAYETQLKTLEEKATEIESRLNSMESTKSDIYEIIEDIAPESVSQDSNVYNAETEISSSETGQTPLEALAYKLDEIEAKTQQAATELTTMNETVVELAAYINSIPNSYPIDSDITSTYGTRVDPVFGTTITHKGVDFDAELNDPVKAAGSGVVITAEYHHSFGNYVIIDHQNGYKTLYAHNTSLNVEVGDYVESGQIISYAGTTGASTGVHVHFEVFLNNINIDPMTVLS